ncbi:hypothetical protein OH76DRAFT_1475677 [Lentinus brumalis]|uniref:RRM domain-containing protein n=1 Tax=Lentinus brumalis TaxID=2498619 RepID=A0A371CNB4_9APHY|nr:hypothetical protein OH76DRAFT_1475677 [Polyporus brumalis]
MSLNEFLGDTELGSWADEMDSLPTAPSGRPDDGVRGGRRDDFLSSRSDRIPSGREDLPLPTGPPYTAFIGNLAFDISEVELEEFFGSGQTKSIKIIKDREDKPKGFGYVEFTDLEALKDAIAKSGSSLAGRGIRVSVAEPQKERSGFGGGGFDDDPKFAGNWRREGPLPDAPSSRDGSRRRFEGPPGAAREPPPPSLSDNASDWRSARGPARTSSQEYPEAEGGFRRRGPGPGPGAGAGPREPAPLGPADTEDTWQRGGKFRPSAPAESAERPGSRFGSARRGEMGPPSAVAEESDWRRQRTISRNSTSPNSSTPPTPQMGRRKLELLPRSSGTSAAPSPLASPNPSTAGQRSNPFGAAKPVDVSAREAEALQKIEKEREEVREKVSHSHPHSHGHPMSRNSSRQGSQRGSQRATSPTSTAQSPTTPQQDSHKLPPANVRPSFSFASAAAGKKDSDESVPKDDVSTITEKIDEVELESSEQ